MRTILLALVGVSLRYLASQYGTGNVGEMVRRKAAETVQALSKIISNRPSSHVAKEELWSADGTTKSFYVLPNGENDGEV